MRTNIVIDDRLIKKGKKYTGIDTKKDLSILLFGTR
jgi:Arc/MetJ family transcription regulator